MTEQHAPSVVQPRDAARRRGRSYGIRRVVRHMRAIRMAFSTLLIFAVLYTLALTSALLIPFVLAGFLALALNPIVALAARLRIPRALGAFVVMGILGGALGTGGWLLYTPVVNWLNHAPREMRHIAPKLKPVTNQIKKATEATRSLMGENSTPQKNARANTAIGVWDVLGSAPAVLANVLTVALLVFFFLVFGEALLRRLVEISPTFERKRHNVEIVRGIQQDVSRYLLTTMVINFTLGAITTVWLWKLGMPDPALWGGVAMLANFIPYVGAISVTLLLAGIGLLHFPHPLHGIVPAFGFACLTAVEGNLITPMILGRHMRLSPVAILIWLLFWGWMWGVPGALLAVPMLTSVKIVTQRMRGWEWFAHMVQR